MKRFTGQLRAGAVWAWSLGLAVIAFDFLSLPVFEWRASVSYLFFALATALTAWAEKREFGTRVFLYRLHDAVIYSPWKYLLLYFLWISVFSPFTSAPLASLVYATNGWLSLFAIGISAQFIFCERGGRGVVLLPKNLALAFYFYAATVSLLMAYSLLLIFAPSLPAPTGERANLLLYFSMGLPFLLWDFVKDGRRLLPRWLTLITIWLGAVAVLLLGRRLYHLALALSVAGVLGLFAYKRIRLRRALLLGGVAAVMVAAAFVGLSLAIEQEARLSGALGLARQEVEVRMKNSIQPAWEAVAASRFLGRGVGVTDFTGVWARVAAEAGVVGLALYSLFFASLLWALYRVRHSPRVVVSNVAALSVGIFILLIGNYVQNPYGAYVWVWYAIWALFASTHRKRASA